ncbi:flavin reductase (DIM6/NTAB) family NADH-FMN oxidoreductase RutF [Bradyrhizobium sp. USDA 4471]
MLRAQMTKGKQRVTDKDLHFYEPAKGHGLRHDPFNAIIAPRPIGWISSRDAKGHVNLAPYSFFNAFCYVPPIIGFPPQTGRTRSRTSSRPASSSGISPPWIWPGR